MLRGGGGRRSHRRDRGDLQRREVHRARLANRRRDLNPFPEPTWNDVAQWSSETEPWSRDRLTADSLAALADNVELVLLYLARRDR